MNKLESRLANQCDSDSLIANEAYDMNFTLFKVTGMVSLITFCQMKWVTPVKIRLWYTLSHEFLITLFHFMKTILSCYPSVAYFKVCQYRFIDSVG